MLDTVTLAAENNFWGDAFIILIASLISYGCGELRLLRRLIGMLRKGS